MTDVYLSPYPTLIRPFRHPVLCCWWEGQATPYEYARELLAERVWLDASPGSAELLDAVLGDPEFQAAGSESLGIWEDLDLNSKQVITAG